MKKKGEGGTALQRSVAFLCVNVHVVLSDLIL